MYYTFQSVFALQSITWLMYWKMYEYDY
uniref:Uncharacterized protein n=1 Tax=Anguilla anguilla TaxID=7936 RepID=A0A0E9U9Q4_ANGAN